MPKIILIGGGQIGSRHLQALALCKQTLEISVLEPSAENREMCRTRFGEIKNSQVHTLNLVETIAELPAISDVTFVATPSAVRRKVVEDFLNSKSTRFLVLEKFLFPAISDYSKVDALLAQKKTSAWVNCNLRTMPVFQWMKASLDLSRPSMMSVEGSKWGLGCNSVHFIDLFLFLTGSETCKVKEANLDAEVLSSKRAGYLEFTGRILLESNKGDRLVLDADHQGEAPIQVAVKNEKASWQFQKLMDRLMVGSLAVKTPMQSELTNLVVEELLMTGGSSLPTWQTSSAYHQVALQVFLDFLKTQNKDVRECLIT